MDNLSYSKRRNVKIDVELPDRLKTKHVNEAIRYGMPVVVSNYGEMRELDVLYGMAMADLLIPNVGATFNMIPV